MAGVSWLTDFEFHPGHLRVKKTGAIVRYGWGVANEVRAWFKLYVAVLAARVRNGLEGRRGPKIAFVPDRPRPWYLVWAVARTAGARFVADPARADVLFHFEDVTAADTPLPVPPPGVRTVNFACRDVSKSRVAAANRAAFGYDLAVDPTAWTGPMVEKSELNGAHDGRIVEGPRAREPGRVYQRVIDNRLDGTDLVEDLRCPTVMGEPILVFRKRRPLDRRFANANIEVLVDEPERVFTQAEREALRRFAAEMGLQWGGVDVLRNREDGRLYVVDVNKTDMGPPTALPLTDQIAATRRLAAAFTAAFAPRART